jgi:3-oxoacyl-[acyl-carrier-protein] synthase-1
MNDAAMARTMRSVLVVGCGAMTPLGMSAPATAAAVRAGIAAFAQHPFLVDRAGERMIVAAAPYLAPDLPSMTRIASLAAGAACEAAGQGPSGGAGRLQVHLGVPPPISVRHRELDEVVDRLIDDLGAAGWRARMESVIEKGHASGVLAMAAAWRAVGDGECEFALAGGADSYIEPETLEWLEACDQVHSTGEENNPYGFVPGEGSGFVLLASAEALQRHGLPALLRLSLVARAHESKLIKTDAVCTGVGLTSLFEELLAATGGGLADHLYCDMNGEPYRADEYGFATIRTGGLLRDASSFDAPADCWGDVGAASGPLFMMLADAAARKHYAAGPVSAAFTGSESGERCGFVLHAANSKTTP